MSTKSIAIIVLALLAAGGIGYYVYHLASGSDTPIIIADDSSIFSASQGKVKSKGTGIYFYRPGGTQGWTDNQNGTYTAQVGKAASWSVYDADTDVLDGGPVLTPSPPAPYVNVTAGTFTVTGCQFDSNQQVVYCSGSYSLKDLVIPKERTKKGHNHGPSGGQFTITADR